MKNEFGINVQSTAEPPNRLDYYAWTKKFRVGIMYQKRDMNTLEKMEDYDFNKLNKKSKKSFVDKLNILSFA